MDNELKIINFLGKNLGMHFTMHKLSKLTGIPYASFYRTVQQMSDVLNTETIGKSKTICLKLKNLIVKAHLTVSSDEERKDFLKRKPIIKKIASELSTSDIVILFGSYAKGKETEKSDIDMLIINKHGGKSLSFTKYEMLFKKKINPIFVTVKEFKQMLKDNKENVGKQALKNHVILNNPERFWELVIHGVR